MGKRGVKHRAKEKQKRFQAKGKRSYSKRSCKHRAKEVLDMRPKRTKRRSKDKPKEIAGKGKRGLKHGAKEDQKRSQA